MASEDLELILAIIISMMFDMTTISTPAMVLVTLDRVPLMHLLIIDALSLSPCIVRRLSHGSSILFRRKTRAPPPAWIDR